MQIGHHFGKRKPKWNFFIDRYQSLIDRSYFTIVKYFVASVGLQTLFFVPALYWIFQNYSIIQAHLPMSFEMHENLEFEKKWIVFLVLSSIVFASVLNAYLWLYLYKMASAKNWRNAEPVENSDISKVNDLNESPDAAGDRRLAS